MSLISSIVLGGIDRLAATFGKTITDIHTSNTARQASENSSGERTAGNLISAHTAAGGQRADVQKAQGTWGPFGIAGFIIAMTFASHVVMIVGDSMPWHLGLTMKFYVLPWLEWVPHRVGSWNVSALPAPFDATEHEILKALFYVGPPSAAVAIAAKAFRR